MFVHMDGEVFRSCLAGNFSRSRFRLAIKLPTSTQLNKNNKRKKPLFQPSKPPTFCLPLGINHMQKKVICTRRTKKKIIPNNCNQYFCVFTEKCVRNPSIIIIVIKKKFISGMQIWSWVRATHQFLFFSMRPHIPKKKYSIISLRQHMLVLKNAAGIQTRSEKETDFFFLL